MENNVKVGGKVKFSEWKVKTMLEIINLQKKYADNSKAVNDLNTILTKLKYAKVRDLSTVFFYMHLASENIPELLTLIPKPEEVERWFEVKS